MRQQDSPLWILTETHESVGPGEEYSRCFSGEPDRPSESGERWVGIWSRFPLEPLPAFASDSSRCAVARVSGTPMGEVIVYGCVLPWSTPWRGIPAANGEAFGAALSLMSSDWQRLREAFPSAALIVAGDFNQSLADHHYYGSKKMLENALASNGLVAMTSGPGDPIARDSFPCACIDHICVSENSGWKAVASTRWPDAERPVRRLSDHFGVTVLIGKW